MAKVTLKLKVKDVCKHSVRYEADQAFVDGAEFKQERPVNIYIPNDIMTRLGVLSKGGISVTLEVI